MVASGACQELWFRSLVDTLGVSSLVGVFFLPPHHDLMAELLNQFSSIHHLSISISVSLIQSSGVTGVM